MTIFIIIIIYKYIIIIIYKYNNTNNKIIIFLSKNAFLN